MIVLSKSKQLDKDLDYCSKCYILCDLKCPICLKQKIKRHCKKYHNPPSLHRHLRNTHPEYVDSEFCTNDAVKELNGTSWALEHEML